MGVFVSNTKSHQQIRLRFSFIQLTASPTVLAIVFSAIFAKGLSAPQHSIVFVILEDERDRPACTPNLGIPLFSSDDAACGATDGLTRFVSPFLEEFCTKYIKIHSGEKSINTESKDLRWNCCVAWNIHSHNNATFIETILVQLNCERRKWEFYKEKEKVTVFLNQIKAVKERSDVGCKCPPSPSHLRLVSFVNLRWKSSKKGEDMRTYLWRYDEERFDFMVRQIGIPWSLYALSRDCTLKSELKNCCSSYPFTRFHFKLSWFQLMVCFLWNVNSSVDQFYDEIETLDNFKNPVLKNYPLINRMNIFKEKSFNSKIIAFNNVTFVCLKRANEALDPVITRA